MMGSYSPGTCCEVWFWCNFCMMVHDLMILEFMQRHSVVFDSNRAAFLHDFTVNFSRIVHAGPHFLEVDFPVFDS